MFRLASEELTRWEHQYLLFNELMALFSVRDGEGRMEAIKRFSFQFFFTGSIFYRF